MSITKATRGSKSVFAGGENGGPVCQPVVGVHAFRLVELLMQGGFAYKRICFLMVIIDHLMNMVSCVFHAWLPVDAIVGSQI